MRVLHSWLQQYVAFRLTPEQLSEKLVHLGLEVASIERLAEKYKGFVVGKVLDVQKHPKADRLTVCRVDIGKEEVTVVCGAPNVAGGQMVPVGRVGAIVPRNAHDPSGPPLTLTQATIRGVSSSGMICSELELDLGTDADGIMVLRSDAQPGEELAVYLGRDDVAYDIEVTPNRPDWLSHFGVAREIGIIAGKPLRIPVVRLRESGDSIRKHLAITVEDTENCQRFAARMVRGVTIAPSPAWLQKTLRNAGLRPRNNVVDVTNYVMLECGHPLHAFDYALLRGGKIIVRQAGGGKLFTTLDGRTHTLPAEAVMVCDAEREVSVAGVMGGANSEIGDATVDVVIESACWKPVSIRRTARALAISTDASMRFERGADIEAVAYALDRAAAMILEVAGGKLLKGKIDVRPLRKRRAVVFLRTARANEILGTRLKEGEITRMLGGLGLKKVGRKAGGVSFAVPTFRVDIEREIDLIEEVARVYGYDRIEAKTTFHVDAAQRFPVTTRATNMRERLRALGYQECLTSSMYDEYRARLSGAKPAKLLNPLGQDLAYMRTSLVPGLLESVARNINRGNQDLRLFEIGHVFSVDATEKPKIVENFLEQEKVCLMVSGVIRPRAWDEPVRNVDLFDLKGDLLALLGTSTLDKCSLIPYSTSDGLTDDALALEIQGTYAGYMGRLRKSVTQRQGIDVDIYAGEFLLEALLTEGARQYVPLPRFPKVKRDLSFVLASDVAVGNLEKTLRQSTGELLESVELFDIYEGESLPAGKKSVAFSITLLSKEKTLTDAEVDACMARVIADFEASHGATLRSS